jgi:type II secretory pathway component PulM
MNDVLARWNLRPFERRLVVGTAVILFIVINIVWVWPHFSDWDKMKLRLADANTKSDKFQKEINQLPTYRSKVRELENDGASVPQEDQAIQFMRTVTMQAGQDHVQISTSSRALSYTNLFFIEQVQNVTATARDDELVKFLYNLGSSSSLIRVRDLSLHTDPPRQNLVANIRLVASYQKNPKPAAPAANSKPATNSPSTSKTK